MVVSTRCCWDDQKWTLGLQDEIWAKIRFAVWIELDGHNWKEGGPSFQLFEDRKELWFVCFHTDIVYFKKWLLQTHIPQDFWKFSGEYGGGNHCKVVLSRNAELWLWPVQFNNAGVRCVFLYRLLHLKAVKLTVVIVLWLLWLYWYMMFMFIPNH